MPPITRPVQVDHFPAAPTAFTPPRPSPTGATRAIPKVAAPTVGTAPVPHTADPVARRRFLRGGL